MCGVGLEKIWNFLEESAWSWIIRQQRYSPILRYCLNLLCLVDFDSIWMKLVDIWSERLESIHLASSALVNFRIFRKKNMKIMIFWTTIFMKKSWKSRKNIFKKRRFSLKTHEKFMKKSRIFYERGFSAEGRPSTEGRSSYLKKKFVLASLKISQGRPRSCVSQSNFIFMNFKTI